MNLKQFLHKKTYMYLALIVLTVFVSYVVAFFVLKVNTNNIYVQTDGTNYIYSSIIPYISLVIITSVILAISDYRKHPIYILLYAFVMVVINLCIDFYEPSLMNVSLIIVAIFIYSILVENKSKRIVLQLIIQEILYFVLFICVMLGISVLLFHDFSNVPDSPISSKGVIISAILVVAIHAILLLVRIVKTYNMKDIKEKLKNAICNNDIAFLEKYKDKYLIDERFEDEDNDTLLLYSISDVESSVYKYLLQNNADINLKNAEGENVLHAIVFSGDAIRLKEILNSHKVDLDEQTNDGATPLLLALSLGNSNLAEILIRRGANVNIGDENNITPLHIAAQDGMFGIMSLLIEKGANPKIKTTQGNYPLALAVNKDHYKVIKYLYTLIYQ